jgi:hypothetical protein
MLTIRIISVGSENKEAHSSPAVLPIFKKKHIFNITRNWNARRWIAHSDMMFIPH